MALDRNELKAEILDKMKNNPENKDDFMENLADAIAGYLVDNLEVTLPPGSVVTTVTGQAVATKNPTSIVCEVK